MGKIKMPPSDIKYSFPKSVGKGHSIAIILGRAMIKEHFEGFGDYMRIVDLLEWKKNSKVRKHKEIRFTQYYKKANGNDNDWIYAQGAGHMSIKTFYKLIKKAKENPDYGDFQGVFDEI